VLLLKNCEDFADMPIRRNRRAGEVSPESSEDEGASGPRVYSRRAPPVKRRMRVVKRDPKQKPPNDFEVPEWVIPVKSDRYFTKILEENPKKTMLQYMNEAFPKREWGKETRLNENSWQMIVRVRARYGGLAWYGVGQGQTKQEAKQNAAMSLILSWMKKLHPDRGQWEHLKEKTLLQLRLTLPESFKNVLYGASGGQQKSKDLKRKKQVKSEARPLKRRRMNMENDFSHSKERSDRRRRDRGKSNRRPAIPNQRPQRHSRNIPKSQPEDGEFRRSAPEVFQEKEATFAEELINSALSTQSPIQDSELRMDHERSPAVVQEETSLEMEPGEIEKSTPKVLHHQDIDTMAVVQDQEEPSPKILQEENSEQNVEVNLNAAEDTDVSGKDDVVFVKKMEDGELSEDDNDADVNEQNTTWNRNWGMDLDGDSDDVLSGSEGE